MKRLTLSERDALHAYDWLRMYWRGDDHKFGGCFECEQLGRRLERFIGPVAVRRIARLVKANPGVGFRARAAAVARTKKKKHQARAS